MILLLDAGNSRIKWGCWQRGHWHGRGAVGVTEPEALRTLLVETMPSWVGISCVAGETVRAALAALLEEAGLAPYWLSSAAEGHGLVNRYAQPETLGVDRYAALIGAARAGYGPCVVTCAGTAVTVDAMTGKGEFLGGMILPGAALMRQALASGTAAVSALGGSWQLFPRSTAEAVETGVRTALAAAVRTMHARLVARTGKDAAIVLAGGDADLLASSLSADAWDGALRIDEYLVLEGLLWVARDLDVPGA